jgi:hypothetical protein
MMNTLLYFSTFGYLGQGELEYTVAEDGQTIVSKTAPTPPIFVKSLNSPSSKQRLQPAPENCTSAYGSGISNDEITKIKQNLISVAELNGKTPLLAKLPSEAQVLEDLLREKRSVLVKRPPPLTGQQKFQQITSEMQSESAHFQVLLQSTARKIASR